MLDGIPEKCSYALNIVSNSIPFYSKSKDPTIPEKWQ